MARKRDIIVAVIIAVSFVFVFVIFAVMMFGTLAPGDMEFAGFSGGSVGVVNMYGVMYEESGRPVIEQLKKWQDNSSIKAIVVHINSGGGGVAISQEIYDAILRVREEKPVVASMASVAASGGYYIACAADRVVANPGSLTGSIGVIASYHTFQELMKKIGIDTETIKSGELKDVFSYHRSMTEKEELMIQAVINDSYEQFVEVVAKGRDMDKEEIYPLADGSVFTGQMAYNLGLVDTLGGLHEAVQLAAELAGLEEDPKIVRPYKRERFSLADLLTGLLGDVRTAVESTPAGPKLLYEYQ
ncbi:MAG: signal peptide peptidase SppA [Candidatus Zixiibacteriota bacterium]|nr:MAG: signal peptide peptidase SppA [candidate division Zixibacteria bacterium]